MLWRYLSTSVYLAAACCAGGLACWGVWGSQAWGRPAPLVCVAGVIAAIGLLAAAILALLRIHSSHSVALICGAVLCLLIGFVGWPDQPDLWRWFQDSSRHDISRETWLQMIHPLWLVSDSVLLVSVAVATIGLSRQEETPAN